MQLHHSRRRHTLIIMLSAALFLFIVAGVVTALDEFARPARADVVVIAAD